SENSSTDSSAPTTTSSGDKRKEIDWGKPGRRPVFCLRANSKNSRTKREALPGFAYESKKFAYEKCSAPLVCVRTEEVCVRKVCRPQGMRTNRGSLRMKSAAP